MGSTSDSVLRVLSERAPRLLGAPRRARVRRVRRAPHTCATSRALERRRDGPSSARERKGGPRDERLAQELLAQVARAWPLERAERLLFHFTVSLGANGTACRTRGERSLEWATLRDAVALAGLSPRAHNERARGANNGARSLAALECTNRTLCSQRRATCLPGKPLPEQAIQCYTPAPSLALSL